MEESTAFRCFGAFGEDGVLVGFASVLTYVVPHYGKRIATVESLFVAAAHRGWPGGKLMGAIEEHARAEGCLAILYSAPARSQLARLLFQSEPDYRNSHHVFIKRLQWPSDLAIPGNMLPPAPLEVIEMISNLERKMRERPQIHPQMEHVLHAGMYARTCRLAAGVSIVSVLIKIPTMLIVHGGAHVFAGERWYRIEGYQCMPAAARAQASVCDLRADGDHDGVPLGG